MIGKVPRAWVTDRLDPPLTDRRPSRPLHGLSKLTKPVHPTEILSCSQARVATCYLWTWIKAVGADQDPRIVRRLSSTSQITCLFTAYERSIFKLLFVTCMYMCDRIQDWHQHVSCNWPCLMQLLPWQHHWYQTPNIVTVSIKLKEIPPDKIGDITAQFGEQYCTVYLGGESPDELLLPSSLLFSLLFLWNSFYVRDTKQQEA